jgi:hypothetical protein
MPCCVAWLMLLDGDRLVVVRVRKDHSVVLTPLGLVFIIWASFFSSVIDTYITHPNDTCYDPCDRRITVVLFTLLGNL